MLMVLHTWGQKLEHHPHVHCVVPGGGLAVPTPATGATATESAAQAPRWVSCRPDWFLPVLVLSPVFRGKYLAALRQTYHAGELQIRWEHRALGKPAGMADIGTDVVPEGVGGLRQGTVWRSRAGAQVLDWVHAPSRLEQSPPGEAP